MTNKSSGLLITLHNLPGVVEMKIKGQRCMGHTAQTYTKQSQTKMTLIIMDKRVM